MWNHYTQLDFAVNLNISSYILHGSFPHLLFAISFSLSPTYLLPFIENLNKLVVSFNLLIRCCCDSGYPWRMKIDWLLWSNCENPNSPVSTGDVTTLNPAAEAGEAHCNSSHTLQLVNTAQYIRLVYLWSLLTALSRMLCDHMFQIQTAPISII